MIYKYKKNIIIINDTHNKKLKYFISGIVSLMKEKPDKSLKDLGILI